MKGLTKRKNLAFKNVVAERARGIYSDTMKERSLKLKL